MRIDPSNWYWSIAGQIYSSARNTYVTADDADYVAWLGAGNAPTPIDSEANIWPYVAPFLPGWLFNGTTFSQPTATTYTKGQLKAYAASLRFDKETGGIAVGGVNVRTDRESQAMVNAAYNMANRDASFTTQWKGIGGFAPLDAPTIIALAATIGQHVAACFAKEADVASQIDAGTLISLPEINAAFASIV